MYNIRKLFITCKKGELDLLKAILFILGSIFIRVIVRIWLIKKTSYKDDIINVNIRNSELNKSKF